MSQEHSISDALRRRGVAASTIREALGPWILDETDRVIKTLATGSSNHVDLLSVQADAKALHRLKLQLELAMTRGGVNEN